MLNVDYHRDIVLTSIGGVSEDLVTRVREILQETFGFHGIEIIINRDIRNIKPYLDGEPRCKQSKNDVKTGYQGKHVYIVQYLKIFDHRLTDLASELIQFFTNFDPKEPQFQRYIEQLEYLAMPDLENSIGARFMSSRFNPSTVANQLFGQINAAKMGKARHISVVIPKTIFEWSHHFRKIWREKNRYEMNSFQIFIENMMHVGAHSAIVLHPHAPQEGLEISRAQKLNYVMIYPQTFTISSNGWIYSLEKVFGHFPVFNQRFDPIKYHIEEYISKLDRNRGLSRLMIYLTAPDRGSYSNAQMAAERFGLKCLKSLKERLDEGKSQIIDYDSLDEQLKQLRVHTSSGRIYFLILDDKGNTLGTANTEAGLRKSQIYNFNKKYGTNYDSFVELIITHLRYPELANMSHSNLDKVTFFNSVPYFPPLKEQLSKLGIFDKFNIIPYTPEQLSLGIALDYFAQNTHIDLERDVETGNYRESTDKDLVMKLGYGKKMNVRMTFGEHEY